MKHLLYIATILIVLTLSSCFKGESVDIIIHNARVHTLTELEEVMDAIALRDGKIIEVGPERQILNKYSAKEYIDAGLKDIYPGFTDAHAHLMSYARLKLSVDLVGCKSYEEMINRIKDYQKGHDHDFIIGRGWDQSIWAEGEMPSNDLLNEIFPDLPVCLFRIDGHALLANDLLIDSSQVYSKFVETDNLSTGGYFIKDKNGANTGVFVDNAMNPILEILPDFPKKDIQKSLLEIQDELIAMGVTGIHEAGLTNFEVELLEELIDSNKFHLNVYGMLLPSSENYAFAKEKGHYRNKNLYIRSFKVYGDGALGSRGAFLKAPYHDLDDHYGYLVTNQDSMVQISEFCKEVGYQMNTHAIGDSANRVVLDIYKETFLENPDHRWRIEHAQVVDPKDMQFFALNGVFPSVQPTHATSDMRWAEDRVGEARMEGAYAYKKLLETFGMIALGTDFPVENTDPYGTIFSAVVRKNSSNQPEEGFRIEEAIGFKECLKGMTIWAAIASFQERELGTLEKGKDATLFIVEKPYNLKSFQKNFSYITFIKGIKVYSLE